MIRFKVYVNEDATAGLKKKADKDLAAKVRGSK